MIMLGHHCVAILLAKMYQIEFQTWSITLCFIGFSPNLQMDNFTNIRGDIYTQVATLNVNMTIWEWGWVGVALLTSLLLQLWQNDIFLILM